DAVGMRLHRTLEDEDLAVRQVLAQMVVAAAVAKPELQNGPRQARDLAHRPVETGALDHQATDHAVESAHASGLRLGLHQRACPGTPAAARWCARGAAPAPA